MSDEPVTILVCDDNDAGRYTKVRPLRHAGYEIIEAASGGEALRLMETHRPPLAVMDVKLPDMSGLEVTAIIKRDYPGVFILQTSASFVGVDDRVRGLDEGADAYLIQPMEPRELVAAVRALLRIRAVEDQLRTSRAAQRDTEARYRMILESATDFAIIATDLKGCVTAWNSGARNILGWDEAEMRGKDVRRIWTPEDRAAGADDAEIETARRTGRAEDQRWHLRKDGSRFWANGLMMTLNDDSGAIVGNLKILRDQTRQREADAALKDAEARLRIAQHAGGVGTFEWRPAAGVFVASDVYRKLWGLSSEAPLTAEALAEQIHPEDRVRAATLPDVQAERHVYAEFRISRADTGETRWLARRGEFEHGPDGEPLRFVGAAYDVTDRKQVEEALTELNATLEQRVAERTAELEAANAQLRAEGLERERAEDALRQAQKMEAVGQLTGGIAHDFNNLLTVIRGSVELLQRPNVTEDRRLRYIQAIADTTTRATKLTNQLLAFARRQTLQPELFDACQSVTALGDMIRTLAGSSIMIETRVPGPLFVSADPSQFDTAVVNMAVNARDAMAGEGRLMIAVNAATTIPAARSHPAVEGDFVAISLTDSGSGIPPEQIEHIFEPFYTTKEVGKGTGLGLSQVFGFAKQSGGEVTVESEPGQGSTFTVYLPRAAAPGSGPAPSDPAEAPVQGRGTCVLVVEDNVEVGEFAVNALKELGYHTVLAENGEAALAKLAQSGGGGIRAVFSDVVMPGMNGIELGEQIRRLYPEMPVLLTSGYSHVLAEGGTYGFELLQKPYSIEQLSRVLERAVGRRAPD